jgi:hypothetical protein
MSGNHGDLIRGLAFDPARSLQAQNDPDALTDFRTPAFDMDNIYGRGVYGHPNMLTEIEARFREGRIQSSDCQALKTLITNSVDESNLESAIYIFGRSCPLDADVLGVCMFHILKKPEPGLTAACMRTAFDHWGRWEANKSALAAYIDMSRYDDWYDEVIFASRFLYKFV